MINILRKNQKWLWIVIGILAIPFCFYFVKTDTGAIHSDTAGRIYGKNISQMDSHRSDRLLELARNLGMQKFVQAMTMGAMDEASAKQEFLCHREILAHEAEKFGIETTPAEVAAVVKTLPAFQGKSGGFDLERYTMIVQNYLPSQGFTEAQLEEIVSNQIELDKVKALVATGVRVPESELKENYEEAFGKLEVAVVRFRNEDFAKGVKVEQPEIEQYFKAHQAELVTEAKRRVDLVEFGLTDEQKKLQGKARIEVLQKLADRANDFAQALLVKGADFNQVAAKFQAPVKTTGDFTQTAPDPLLKADPALAQAAAALSVEQPTSDTVQASDGFYMLHLAGLTAARPLTMEEAKPRIVEAITVEKTRTAIAAKATEAANGLRQKMAAGAPVEAAAPQAGLKAEKLPPFSLAKNRFVKEEADKPEPNIADLNEVRGAISELKPGEMSKFTPTKDGGLIAVLEKREPLNQVQFAKASPELQANYRQAMETVLLYEWLRDRRAESGFAVPPSPQQNQQPQEQG